MHFGWHWCARCAYSMVRVNQRSLAFMAFLSHKCWLKKMQAILYTNKILFLEIQSMGISLFTGDVSMLWGFPHSPLPGKPWCYVCAFPSNGECYIARIVSHECLEHWKKKQVVNWMYMMYGHQMWALDHTPFSQLLEIKKHGSLYYFRLVIGKRNWSISH